MTGTPSPDTLSLRRTCTATYGNHQYYFACQVSDHCVKGQKIAVTVR